MEHVSECVEIGGSVVTCSMAASLGGTAVATVTEHEYHGSFRRSGTGKSIVVGLYCTLLCWSLTRQHVTASAAAYGVSETQCIVEVGPGLCR